MLNLNEKKKLTAHFMTQNLEMKIYNTKRYQLS